MGRRTRRGVQSQDLTDEGEAWQRTGSRFSRHGSRNRRKFTYFGEVPDHPIAETFVRCESVMTRRTRTDVKRIDRLSRALARSGSRRTVLKGTGALAALVTGGALRTPPALATAGPVPPAAHTIWP